MSSCDWTNEYDRDPRGPRIRRTGPHNADASGWRYLHLSAIDGKLSHNRAMQFAACIGCPDCKRHFLHLLRTHPIRSMASQDEAFATTVRWHNAVNQRLGKPSLEIEAARQLWGVVKRPHQVAAAATPFSQAAMG